MRFFICGFALYCSITIGQAFGQFTTILNIPPDPNIGDDQSIGSDTQLNLFDGGEIGKRFRAGSSTAPSTNIVVNIRGGSIGQQFVAYDGSTVNITGGQIGEDFIMYDGTVNVSGGEFGLFNTFYLDSVLNLSGGSMGEWLWVEEDGAANLYGTQFILDDVDITPSLRPNEPFTIEDRGASLYLEGLLADGSDFSFELVPDAFDNHQPFFDPNATLTVTLVQPGDTNADGFINIDDLNNVRNHFGETGSADGTLPGDVVPWNGMVDIDDINAVRNNFGASAASVPEPSAAPLGIVAISSLRRDCFALNRHSR